MIGALWVAKGLRFLREESFDGRSMGTQGSMESSMGALWVAKGLRFLQEENLDGLSIGTQGFKISS